MTDKGQSSSSWCTSPVGEDVVFFFCEYTLWQINIDPENHQFLEETNLPNPIYQGPTVNLLEGKHGQIVTAGFLPRYCEATVGSSRPKFTLNPVRPRQREKQRKEAWGIPLDQA